MKKQGKVILSPLIPLPDTWLPLYGSRPGTKYATRIIMDGLRMEEAQNHIKPQLLHQGNPKWANQPSAIQKHGRLILIIGQLLTV